MSGAAIVFSSKSMLRWGLSLALVYGLFLLSNMPAQRVVSWAQVQPFWTDSVILEGVQGTIWSGSVRAAYYEGLELRALSWRWRWSSALRMRLAFDFEFYGFQRAGHGRIAFVPGQIILTHLKLSEQSPNELLELMAVPLNATGNLSADILRLRFSYQEGVRDISGSVSWEHAGLVFLNAWDLGSFKADLSPDHEGGLLAAVSNAGEPLGADLILHLDYFGGFALRGSLQPGAGLAQPVKAVLQSLGSEDSDGRINLHLSGNL